MSLPRTHTHQDRLRDDFERTHTHLRPLRDYTTFRAPVPGRPQITIIVIWAFFTQDVTSLARLLQSCWGGRSPVIASPRVSPPSDALCHPRPDSSSLKIVIVQETPPAILLIAVVFQRSAITNHSFLAPDIATIGDSVQGSPLLNK